jgi:hypothetical protein
LEEALFKYAETVACDAKIDHILAMLEPQQLGAGAPDRMVLLVNVLVDVAYARVDARVSYE